jgi:hypothetical protein
VSRLSVSVWLVGVAATAISSVGCEAKSYITGVVRTPGQKCAEHDEEPVSNSVVEVVCPPDAAATVIRHDDPPTHPATSDEKGAFEITVRNVDAALSGCRLRVQREGYETFEASISELEHQHDPQRAVRTFFVRLHLRRSLASP